MEDKLKKLILLMEIRNEEKFSSFNDSVNQLDKQGIELSNDIDLVYKELSKIEGDIKSFDVSEQIKELKSDIENIQLQKGDKGDKGEDGKNGKDGVDGKDGRDGIDGLDGLNGKDGVDGKDGSPDTGEQIVEKINTLENVIEIKTIKDFPNIESTVAIKRQVETIGNQVLRLLSKQPQTVDLSAYVPTTRTLTINGTTYDLSADRTWSVGTVTSVAALTLGTTGTDLSSSVATGTTTPVITLNVPTASALNRGALSSTDWSTFNSKESALTFSTGLTRSINTITNNLSTGISGGQSVIGGTASGNNLTLSSTSNATKGKILFGTSAYDEVNNRLGVGTTSPSQKLSVNGNAAVGLDTTYLPDGATKAGGALLVGSTSLISSLGYGTLQDNVIQLGDNVSTSSYTHSPSMAFSTNQTSANQLLGRFLGLNSSLSTAEKRLGQISFYTDTATNNGKIDFAVNNGTSFIIPLTIKSSGNVGIGTTTPGNLLSIVGNSSTPGGVAFNVKNSNVSGDTRFSLSSSNNRTINVQVTGDSYVVNQKGAYLFTDGGLSNMTFMTDGDVGSGGSGYISFATGGYTLTTQERMRITSTGNIGIGITSPSAVLHLKAGTATANTAPLKFTSGTNTTVAVAGQMEYNNTFHLTNSDATRRHVVTAPNTTKVTAAAPYTNDGYIIVNIGGIDFKLMTTA